MDYDSIKEIIKIRNLIDERIMFSPEHLYQLNSEIKDLKVEISNLTKTIIIVGSIFATIQILLFFYFVNNKFPIFNFK